MRKKYQAVKVELEPFGSLDMIMASTTVPTGTNNDGTLVDNYLDEDVLQSDAGL